VSAAYDLLAGLVLEDGRTLGAALSPTQAADAEAFLDPSSPPSHYWTAPRGDGKTTIAAGVTTVDLLEHAPAGSRSYFVAVDRDQAALALDSLRGFVERTPGLSGALTVEARRVIVRATGASVEVLASDGASAFGLRPWRFVVDEFAAWPRSPNHEMLWSAITSSMHKVPGSKLLAVTTAGSPASLAFRVLQHARTSAEWRTSETPGPSARISPEKLAEQQKLLTPAQFARLHLNQWSSADEALVRAEDLAACVAHDDALEPARGARYVVGLDVGLTRDRTAVAVLHTLHGRDNDGEPRVVVDRVVRVQGTRARSVRLDDVEALVADVARRYNGARVIADPWQAVGLCQRLRARGLRIEEQPFTTSSNARMAATLFRLFRDRAIALPNDRALLDELARVQLVETSTGTVRLNHAAGEHDDQAVAIGLAATQLLTQQKAASVADWGPGFIAANDSLWKPNEFDMAPRATGWWSGP